MDNRPIGIFDSGLGGLTCINPITKALPNERIIYFGDTARTPYGSKSPETVVEFALQIADFLVKQGAKLLVIACNTISSTAIGELESAYPDIPVLGIIEPAATEIAQSCTAANSIGIIGTKVTIKSDAYKKAISKEKEGLNIHSLACPAFVPLIEEGIIENEIMDLTIHHYLDSFVGYHHIDTLVLGCTHYPLIVENLRKSFKDLRIVNPSETLAGAVSQVLSERGLLAGEHKAESMFCASDLSENFVNMINRIVDKNEFKIALRKF